MKLSKEIKDAIGDAIFDPGAIVGYKGNRSRSSWERDAVIEAIERKLNVGNETSESRTVLVGVRAALIPFAEQYKDFRYCGAGTTQEFYVGLYDTDLMLSRFKFSDLRVAYNLVYGDPE